MPKYVIEFSKQGLIKYTSHLDMIRLFKRTFKKANIKLAYSQGFNPHPKMAFPLPLSLGYESSCELLEFETIEPYGNKDIIKESLNTLLPEGIEINWIKENKGKDNISGSVIGAEYILAFPVKISCGCSSCGGNDLCSNQISNEKNPIGEAVKYTKKYWGDFAQKFMGQEEILVEKKKKSKNKKKGVEYKEIDIKPLITTINVTQDHTNIFITAKVKAGSVSNLNPELLFQAVVKFANLSTDKEDLKILRTEIILDEK